MFVIITRSFPPEIGGMQNLMKGLAVELSKYEMIKVFADYYDDHEKFDNNLSFSIERVGGLKVLNQMQLVHVRLLMTLFYSKIFENLYFF